MKKKSFKMLVLSDTHCGHITGLTPPAYWRNVYGDNESIAKLRSQQEERWNWFSREIAKVKRTGYEYILFNGDAIDGQSARLGGAERLELLENQVDMAEAVIKECITDKVKKVFLTSGTSYHTRTNDGAVDLEKSLRTQISIFCDAIYSPLPFIEINHGDKSFIIKCRHKTSKGTIRGGGAISGAIRQLIDSILLEKIQGDPATDMILLSHVHECTVTPLFKPNGTPLYAITTPALQGRGSHYGMTECSGVIHFGFIMIEVSPTANGWNVTIDPRITQLNADVLTTYKVNLQ